MTSFYIKSGLFALISLLTILVLPFVNGKIIPERISPCYGDILIKSTPYDSGLSISGCTLESDKLYHCTCNSTFFIDLTSNDTDKEYNFLVKYYLAYQNQSDVRPEQYEDFYGRQVNINKVSLQDKKSNVDLGSIAAYVMGMVAFIFIIILTVSIIVAILFGKRKDEDE